MRAVPRSRYLIFGAIAGLGCLADLTTKAWVFGLPQLHGGRILWIWPDVLGLQTSLNEGALFGVGQGRVSLFAILSIAALIGILVWLFVAGAARDWFLTIALGLVTAGILGNLYDRLGLPGLLWEDTGLHALGDPVYAVRDWVLVMIGHWQWPNFNIADPLLVAGATLLAWHAFSANRDQPSVAGGETHVS
jgi:signal peptidase II